MSAQCPAQRVAPGVHELEPQTPPTVADVAADGFAWLVARARRLGFARIGALPADGVAATAPAYQAWLQRGLHGQMAYLEQPRLAPEQLLPGARSVLVGAMSYGARQVCADAPIAAYTAGADYHRVLKQQLLALAQDCADLLQRPLRVRPCVDTAPVLERAWAEAAGVAFIGKSTLAIAPGVGSATLLGELVLDAELPDAATESVAEGCGSCTACLQACPTGAFSGPYVLDARRCISYLTIEYGGSIPIELRPKLGAHLFGCDICQRVCPYNWSKKLPAGADALYPGAAPGPAFPADATQLALEVLNMSGGDHKRYVRGSAMSRASRKTLQRNAAVVLGNSGEPGVVPALAEALGASSYPLVRSHVAWALGQLGGALARSALEKARSCETDADVVAEVDLALVALATLR